jgi:hypothetical protein
VKAGAFQEIVGVVVVADVPLIVTPVMKGGAPMLGSIALVVNVAGLFV